MARPIVGTVDPPSEPTGGGAGSASAILAHGARVGRYVILNVIGRGGMGVVYAAHDPQLDRQVALKLIRTADSVEESERLVREAQALAKLADPHVVAVYDAGEVDGQVFVAMQLVDGEDLAAALLKRRRSEDVAQILSWFRDAGRGLAAAHAARLVHRDFKPSNVLIDNNGRVAVTDFGIAREQGRTKDPERRALSSADRLLGTPAYMAPEQHALDRATEASDQFAFCVSLWEALFDQHPFVADRVNTSSVEIGIAVFEGKLIPPRTRGRGAHRVPRRVVDALARGLTRDPAARWPSMTALIGELEPARRRRRWPWVVAAAVAGAAALAGAAVLAWPWPWHGGGGAAANCELDARVTAAWPGERRARIADQLAHDEAHYGPRVATTLTSQLDADAADLHAAAREACAAPRGGGDPASARAAGCLAARTAELDGFVIELARGAPAAVDHAIDAEHLLDRVAACGPTRAAEPPSALLATASRADAVRTGRAIGLVANGEADAAERELADIAVAAGGLGLHEREARAWYLRGAIAHELDQPARADLERAVAIAVEHRLDDIAANAWIGLVRTASAAELDIVWAATDAAVRRTGDPRLAAFADIHHGVALQLVGRSHESGIACYPYTAARDDIDPWLRHLARMCVAGSDLLAGTAEAKMLLADVAELSAIYGEHHPALAETLAFLGELVAITGGSERSDGDGIGNLVEALAMYERRYPAGHVKIAVAHDELGVVAQDLGHVDEARARYRAAVAAIAPRRDLHPRVAGGIYDRLASVSPPAEALDAIRIAAGLSDDTEILVEYATVAADAEAWGEAFAVAMRARAQADGHDEVSRARIDWALARAMAGVHGDLAEARRLAQGARAVLAAHHHAAVAAIDAWLARAR